MQHNPYEQVFIQACNLLSTYKPKESSFREHLETHSIIQKFNKLQLQKLDLPMLHQLPEGIYARTPVQKHKIRLSIYYMSAGKTMTLHNHPQMIVISFVISGRIKAKYYTQLNNHMVFRKEEIILIKDSVNCIDGNRSLQHNLHQLKAQQNSLFLDIIYPDYNQTSRQCRYFRQEQQVGQNQWILKEIEDDVILNDF